MRGRIAKSGTMASALEILWPGTYIKNHGLTPTILIGI